MMNGLSTTQGLVTPEMIAHIGARAKTGAGLIIIGDSAVDYDYGVTHYTPLDLGNEENLANFILLAEECHRWGAKIGVELQHGRCHGLRKNQPIRRAPVSMAVTGR